MLISLITINRETFVCPLNEKRKQNLFQIQILILLGMGEELQKGSPHTSFSSVTS